MRDSGIELGAKALDLRREALAREGVEADLDVPAHREEAHVGGARLGADLDPGGVDELEERRARGDVAADLDVARGDPTRPRRRDPRLGERELRRREPRLGDVAVGDRVEELGLRHGLAFEEVLRAFVLELRLAEPGLGLGDLLRQGALVDRRQRLALGDELSELAAHRLDRAADFCRQHCAMQRLEASREARAIDDRARLDRQRAHLRDAFGGRRLLRSFRRGTAGERGECAGSEGEDDDRARGESAAVHGSSFCISVDQGSVGSKPTARERREASTRAS